MAASTPASKSRFQDQHNLAWLDVKNRTFADRDGVDDLYKRLSSNQEIVLTPGGRGVPARRFGVGGSGYAYISNCVPPGHESVLIEEQEHHLNALLGAQLDIARIVCSSTVFDEVCHKRMVVLQRIFHAVLSRCQDGGLDNRTERVGGSGMDVAAASVTGNDGRKSQDLRSAVFHIYIY